MAQRVFTYLRCLTPWGFWIAFQRFGLFSSKVTEKDDVNMVDPCNVSGPIFNGGFVNVHDVLVIVHFLDFLFSCFVFYFY